MPTTMKFSKALYNFEAFLEVEKNLSPRTRNAYIYDLTRFADFWTRRNQSVPPLERITTEDIKRYLEHLRMDRHLRSTTLSRAIASIRIFFEFCVVQKYLESSPAAYIHNPKNPKKLPIFLVDSELKRLLAAPAQSPPAADNRPDLEHLPQRDTAILATLGFTGLRLRELVGVSLPDLDLERRSVRVMGKGSKERIVPLNAIVVAALQEWLAVRSPATPDENAVFLNRFGRRISPRGVEKIVARCVLAAGITKEKISPHKLRHTFATLLHLNGVDILEIQALLGHSSVTSTQIYTHVSQTKLKHAVEQLEDI